MASLGQIRDAIARTIDNGTAMELYTYARVEELANFPAVIIEPDGWDPDRAMGYGSVKWAFNVFVLTSYNASAAYGQDELDQLLDVVGSNSIPRALQAEGALGLKNTEAHAYAMRGYGGRHELCKIPHIGAVLKVWVETDGS